MLSFFPFLQAPSKIVLHPVMPPGTHLLLVLFAQMLFAAAATAGAL